MATASKDEPGLAVDQQALPGHGVAAPPTPSTTPSIGSRSVSPSSGTTAPAPRSTPATPTGTYPRRSHPAEIRRATKRRIFVSCSWGLGDSEHAPITRRGPSPRRVLKRWCRRHPRPGAIVGVGRNSQRRSTPRTSISRLPGIHPRHSAGCVRVRGGHSVFGEGGATASFRLSSIASVGRASAAAFAHGAKRKPQLLGWQAKRSWRVDPESRRHPSAPAGA